MKNLIVSCLLILLLFLSCSKNEPAADFTVEYQATPCFVPCTVIFTSESKNVESLLWDFGDGTQSRAFIPEAKVYDQAGTYEVSLTVTGEDGGEAVATKPVEVTAEPTTVAINRVFVHQLPLQSPGGINWDPGNGQEAWPDLFFTIQDNRAVREFENPEATISNVDTSMLPVHWEFDPPIELTGFNRTFFFEINDNDDPDPPFRIGYVNFRPADYQFITNQYPTRLELTRDSTVAINVELTWK